jgi:hypothetical protein
MRPNYLLVDDCRQCVDWCPADTYGNGTACGAMPGYPVIPSVIIPGKDERTPIPQECPRLAQQGFDVKSVRDLLCDFDILLHKGSSTEDETKISDRIQKALSQIPRS